MDFVNRIQVRLFYTNGASPSKHSYKTPILHTLSLVAIVRCSLNLRSSTSCNFLKDLQEQSGL